MRTAWSRAGGKQAQACGVRRPRGGRHASRPRSAPTATARMPAMSRSMPRTGARRDPRLCRDRGRRPRDQSAHRARPGDRRAGAGAGRRVPRPDHLRRATRRSSTPRSPTIWCRSRPISPNVRAITMELRPLEDQSARRQGRRRGRHGGGRGDHRQRRRGGACAARRRDSRPAAVAGAALDSCVQT